MSQSKDSVYAKHYRDLSARLRLEAARTKSDGTSFELLSIAAMFELLAQHRRELAEAAKREQETQEKSRREPPV